MPENTRATATKPELKAGHTSQEIRLPDSRLRPVTIQEQLLFRQKTVGNQAVQRLIKSGALRTPQQVAKAREPKILECGVDASPPVAKKNFESGLSAALHSTSPVVLIPRAVPQRKPSKPADAYIKPIAPARTSIEHQVDRAWYNFNI